MVVYTVSAMPLLVLSANYVHKIATESLVIRLCFTFQFSVILRLNCWHHIFSCW